MQTLVSAEQMRELERQSAELGLSPRLLMEAAGRTIAEHTLAMLPEHGVALVACGGGNNGGDGFVAARALKAQAVDVRVFAFCERSKVAGDAEAALSALEKLSGVTVTYVTDTMHMASFCAGLELADVVVDALVGTGIKSSLRGLVKEAVERINAAKCKVLSVDMPSGVDSDTGQLLGNPINAHTTVALGFYKRGHYLFPGAQHRGNLVNADIGVPTHLAVAAGVKVHAILAADGPKLLGERGSDTHKGNFGHVVVVAGGQSTPGAASLTLHGALRAGAGLVSWATDEATARLACRRPDEAMLRLTDPSDTERWAQEVVRGATALVVGPGWTAEAVYANRLAALLTHRDVPKCLDAGALNVLAVKAHLWELIGPTTVLTPHPKEMSRLADRPVGEIQRDRLAAAQTLAVSKGCVVVLKGAGTVVADPHGNAYVVAAGNPGLATGGTGDVLAGIIGGLLAQKMEACVAAKAGVLLHGLAADAAVARHGQAGLRASDVVEAMGEVWARWGR